MIYVYTSILSGFDNLRPPAVPAESGVRYICFTNVPNLPRVEPWEFMPAYVASEHQGRSSRIPKILPHLLLPADAEYSIYHDGNFRLQSSPHEIIDIWLHRHDWASYAHPCRRCLYDEARVLLEHDSMEGWRLQRPERARAVREEVERYRARGFPEGAGLWANGFLVRRHTPAVAALNEAWWKLYAAGAERDQLSFPVARCQQGLAVETIEGNVYDSPYLQFCWHAAWLDKADNPDYRDERDGIRSRLAKLAGLTGSDGGVKYPEY